MSVKIHNIVIDSPADFAGIKSGDSLNSINNHPINDVLDYRFYMIDKKLEMHLTNLAGKCYTVKIKKPEYVELGMEFESYLMDKKHNCKNKCIFCFIDQLPKGMRSTLYFKDDDARLSFLFGNYITLTNLEHCDIERIINMRISPINVSVHTTNPKLRVEMMGNPRAGEVLSYIKELVEAEINVNVQIVLCPGVNDGDELRRSLKDLGDMYPRLQSVAVVPVGLTKYRDGLYPLSPFTKEQAQEVIGIIKQFSDIMMEKYRENMAYPADEFFIKAQMEIPPAQYYGEFNQLENGVGLLAMLKDSYENALEGADMTVCKRHVTIATGEAAYEFMSTLAQKTCEHIQDLKIDVVKVINNFFGHDITVSGLITGTDLIATLSGRELGEALLLPNVMLRSDEDVFLDNVSVIELENALDIEVKMIDNDGMALLDAILGV